MPHLMTDLHVPKQPQQGTETIEKTLPELRSPLVTRLRPADQRIPAQWSYILDFHSKTTMLIHQELLQVKPPNVPKIQPFGVTDAGVLQVG